MNIRKMKYRPWMKPFIHLWVLLAEGWLFRILYNKVCLFFMRQHRLHLERKVAKLKIEVQKIQRRNHEA